MCIQQWDLYVIIHYMYCQDYWFYKDYLLRDMDTGLQYYRRTETKHLEAWRANCMLRLFTQRTL